MSHLHLNELSLICDVWVNKITYLLWNLYMLEAGKGNGKDQFSPLQLESNPNPNTRRLNSIFAIIFVYETS